MATGNPREIASTKALVIDGNTTSRSILVRQLRDFGVGEVQQCSRILDARGRLEHTVFDFVLCEQFFAENQHSGQTLLDDLRQAHLLPFSTVFFMVTAEASYALVSEAAESALDGYLLKPFTPAMLFERLQLARLRKRHLLPIFEALEQQRPDEAARLCRERFEAQGPYWMYAARIGAELLLRQGRAAEAEALYREVLALRPAPWAELGVARAQAEAGHSGKAIRTLQTLIEKDVGFADAYDVLGRAQVEVADFGAAMASFRRASELTPESVARLQKTGMMAYYTGDLGTARAPLARAGILGLNSKLFDFQSLVLLAFCHLEERDRRGLERCVADFTRLAERHPGSARVRRLRELVLILQLLLQQRFDEVLQGLAGLAAELQAPDFDFEAACNLCNLLAVLAERGLRVDEGEAWVRRLGLRFANTRGLAELVASACARHPPYADRVRESLAQINAMAETAMGRSLAGDVAGAVGRLLDDADATSNTKLIDLAQQLVSRHQATLGQAEDLQARIDALRRRCGVGPARAMLGQEGERSAGGVVLRVRDREAAQARLRQLAAAPVPARAQAAEAEVADGPEAAGAALRLQPQP